MNALQEEITQKTLALCVEASKMTAQLLQQAMKKVLADMEKHKTNPQLHHGKQTIRQLMKHGAGVSNIEITDQNIKAFSATAKKYGIDFALKKDTTGEIPRYLVFFKGRDADAVTAAFREFSAKNLAKEKKPSIRRRLTKAKEQAKRQELERGEKIKNRDRGLERRRPAAQQDPGPRPDPVPEGLCHDVSRHPRPDRHGLHPQAHPLRPAPAQLRRKPAGSR